MQQKNNRIEITRSGGDFTIRYRHRSGVGWFMIVFAILWLAFVEAFFLFAGATDSEIPTAVKFIPFIHLIVGFFILYMAISNLVNSTYLEKLGNTLHIYQKPLNLISSTRQLAVSDIEQFYIKRITSNNSVRYQLNCLKKDGEKRVLMSFQHSSAQIAQDIERLIEDTLNIPDRPVVGAMGYEPEVSFGDMKKILGSAIRGRFTEAQERIEKIESDYQQKLDGEPLSDELEFVPSSEERGYIPYTPVSQAQREDKVLLRNEEYHIDRLTYYHWSGGIPQTVQYTITRRQDERLLYHQSQEYWEERVLETYRFSGLDLFGRAAPRKLELDDTTYKLHTQRRGQRTDSRDPAPSEVSELLYRDHQGRRQLRFVEEFGRLSAWYGLLLPDDQIVL